MRHGLSDTIRALAQDKYVRPALLNGKSQFAIRVKDMLTDLEAKGFPRNHTPQVCSALKTAKFLRDNGLEIESVEGPPSGASTTVVIRYRVGATQPVADPSETGTSQQLTSREHPSERASRLTRKLRGLLKEELAEYGGGDAFLRWVRSEEDDAA